RTRERMRLAQLPSGFWKLTAHYGFMEDPNVLKLLEAARAEGFPYKLNHTTFFLGHETIIVSHSRKLAMWREQLFAFMSRNALSATSFFSLPANRVVEMGSQVEI